MSSHIPNSHSYSRLSTKPATITALVERALENIWDERKELKHFLRIAERSRKDGKEFVKQGDLENAFVSFARAATLVVEKLPTHRDYSKFLDESQRQNLLLVCDLAIFQIDKSQEFCHPHSTCAKYMLTCLNRTVKISSTVLLP